MALPICFRSSPPSPRHSSRVFSRTPQQLSCSHFRTPQHRLCCFFPSQVHIYCHASKIERSQSFINIAYSRPVDCKSNLVPKYFFYPQTRPATASFLLCPYCFASLTAKHSLPFSCSLCSRSTEAFSTFFNFSQQRHPSDCSNAFPSTQMEILISGLTALTGLVGD